MSEIAGEAALVALDASIAHLRAIRAVLAENLAVDVAREVSRDDTPTTGCKHLDTTRVVTLGSAQTLCADCGEQLEDGND
jgi:hypothetical protein